MEDFESLLLLNSVNGLGPVKQKKLLEYFHKPGKIFEADEKKLLLLEGITKKIAQGIKDADKNFDLKREIDLIKRNNVKIITFFDKDYPKNLKEIYDAPLFLYIKGKLVDSDNISLAVVGSRRASLYGLDAAEKISRELAWKGFTIISGLARGIDTRAHIGALKGNGRTIAVLGNGLSNIYPPENKDLAEKILSANGCIMSEFSMETPPDRINFPKRNRIISGLSLGVLVVEAAKHSGALITADFAVRENREVFAMPGKVDSVTSQGTHALIKEGAKLVENTDDILIELKEKVAGFLKNEKSPDENFKPKVGSLSQNEEIVYKFLSKDDAIYIDELVSKTNLDVNLVSGTLVGLQIKKLAKELPGKKYILN